MSSLPSQLTFLDMALVLSPPVILAAELMPVLEYMYGCMTRLPASELYQFVNSLGVMPAIVMSLISFLLLYAIGQVLLGVTDIFRIRVVRKMYNTKLCKWIASHKWSKKVFGPGDPFAVQYHVMRKVIPAFERKIKMFGQVSYPRLNVWTAAAYLQQNGIYTHAERFNIMALYFSCLSTVTFFTAVFSLAASIVQPSLGIWAWTAVLFLLSWFSYHRAWQFYTFFTTTVITSFNAQPVFSTMSRRNYQ